jgi:hypothetical protein
MKPQRQKKEPKPTPKAPATTAPQPAPWVAQMVQHFQTTGYYRAEDLERLLGDPRDSVQATAEPSMQFCAHLSK